MLFELKNDCSKTMKIIIQMIIIVQYNLYLEYHLYLEHVDYNNINFSQNLVTKKAGNSAKNYFMKHF